MLLLDSLSFKRRLEDLHQTSEGLLRLAKNTSHRRMLAILGEL